MQVEIVKWGNSKAVRLPVAVLKALGLSTGDKLAVATESGRIVLSRAAPEYRLKDLLAGITHENVHTEVDTGLPVGREAW